jgi:glycopeptide antibiotics resistance protein
VRTVSDVAVVGRYPTPGLVRTLDVSAKALLVLLLGFALAYPDLGHMKDKAAGLRAVGYPVLAFAIPAVWWLYWRERASFPWLADLLVTLTCFTDTLGNRMNLYDTIVWFDDWMHFMNTGLLAAAVVLLTLHRTSTLGTTLERALAVGVTAALAWEIAEYFAFISKSAERHSAYTDTLGDLTLGTLGALLAAFVIHTAWRAGGLRSAAPQLEEQAARR